jgi:hypothetical protein
MKKKYHLISMNFFFFLQVAKKRKSVEPCSPVEKKARPATKVSKKASTPKSKNIKKTVKQVKSPVPTGSKVVTPKVPGRQKTLVLGVVVKFLFN